MGSSLNRHEGSLQSPGDKAHAVAALLVIPMKGEGPESKGMHDKGLAI